MRQGGERAFDAIMEGIYKALEDIDCYNPNDAHNLHCDLMTALPKLQDARRRDIRLACHEAEVALIRRLEKAMAARRTRRAFMQLLVDDDPVIAAYNAGVPVRTDKEQSE